MMATVAIIVGTVVLLIGVVVLWRSTPRGPDRPEPSEDARTKDAIVDVTPSGGFGGGGGGGGGS